MSSLLRGLPPVPLWPLDQAPGSLAGTVVVGDIGGHLPVLDSILSLLDIDHPPYRLPAGTRVIQVGDLVRAKPWFREQNTEIVRRMDPVLRANPPGAWTQVVGNNECAALGGPAKPDWVVASSFDGECRGVLDGWWSGGRMVLATTVSTPTGVALVTHAGLTRGAWLRLGSPQTPAQAEALLGVHQGGDPVVISTPGSLVTGRVVEDADVMWAEVCCELLAPWLGSGDMPFDQVHGHAAPVHWPSGDWWAGTPDSVVSATTADASIRRSVTRLDSGRTITSVDWTLEDSVPARLWPLLTFPG